MKIRPPAYRDLRTKEDRESFEKLSANARRDWVLRKFLEKRGRSRGTYDDEFLPIG